MYLSRNCDLSAVTVVGYETRGHRHIADALQRL